MRNLEGIMPARSDELRGLHETLNSHSEVRCRCDEEIANLTQANETMEATLSEKNDEILALDNEIANVRKAHETMTKKISEKTAEILALDEEITNLRRANERMEAQLLARSDEIIALHEALQDQQGSDPERNGPLSTMHRAPVAGEPMLEGLSEADQHALQLSYEGKDLSTVRTVTQIEPPELFAVLHRLFCRSDCQPLQVIRLPTNWQLDQNALVTIARPWLSVSAGSI
jgi:chromosome segregation ATPase